MKICGLITEYNPFHNGHVHHMKEAKELTGCDYLIVVMSGNFVQRGTPAIIDKRKRAHMALEAGADLVLELPALFSTASAETFAVSAVNLLTQLGCVDSFCFGTESGDLTELRKIAEVLNHEPASFKEDIRSALKSGMNYPAARALALQNYFAGEIDCLNDLLETPNNILGIEYLRALERIGSSMTPYAIRRWKTDYHEWTTYEDVASATAIRNMLYEEDGIEKVTPFVPSFVLREFAVDIGRCFPVRADDFSQILQYRLMTECDHLTDYLDFSQEIADRVNNLLPDCYTFKEWSRALKTKSYTRTRMNRALMHLILNIRESDLHAYDDEDYCMYAKILGFRKDAQALFSEISAHSALPLISKMADAKNILSEKAIKLLRFDISSTDIFRNVVYQKYGTLLKDEFTSKIIKF